MKKKLVTLLLAGALAISVTACGGSGSDSTTKTTTETTTEPTEEATDIEKAIKETDQAIQDAADATGTDVTSVDEAIDAMSEVAKGGGPATMDKFNQIQTGMTYDEVKEIMGEDGIESVSAESDAASAKVYQWAGETPGSNITVSFLNDGVSSATQVGLE